MKSREGTVVDADDLVEEVPRIAPSEGADPFLERGMHGVEERGALRCGLIPGGP